VKRRRADLVPAVALVLWINADGNETLNHWVGTYFDGLAPASPRSRAEG